MSSVVLSLKPLLLFDVVLLLGGHIELGRLNHHFVLLAFAGKWVMKGNVSATLDIASGYIKAKIVDDGAQCGHSVQLLKAVQELIYGSDSITIESDVWMTWNKGMY